MQRFNALDTRSRQITFVVEVQDAIIESGISQRFSSFLLSASCGGLMKNVSVGRIVSPAFPSNYSNNLTCHWLLEAPEGQRLHVHFEKVALAEDDDR